MPQDKKIKIVIDPDLKDIVPGYLKSVTQEWQLLSDALAKSDLESISRLAHRMKGVALSYGFARLTEIGKAMELAAEAKDKIAIERLIGEMKDYLTRVELVES